MLAPVTPTTWKNSFSTPFEGSNPNISSLMDFFCQICFVRPGVKIAPRGFEPLKEKQQLINNKRLTANDNSVLSTGLDKILQKSPDLEKIIVAWPNLPEHIKAAIKTLVEAHKGKEWRKEG
jgi:hypothetical protein